jgi:Zinc carboxypeptidase
VSKETDKTQFEAALAQVPNYERFYTLEEMVARTKATAENHPDLTTLQIVGHSTDGLEIPMLRIGNGPTHLLLFACPHPNEPIGAMLIQFLLEELVTNEKLREGRSWFLLPCVDPDGTRLNEGWFAGPYTIRNYAKHFYRPPSTEQVEWTFPIHYKDLKFDKPLPETEALMQAFDIAKPQFVYSLHNAGFGGVYYYISHDLPDVYDAFHTIPRSRDLVLSLGEAEMPWAVEFAPAVYKTSSIKEAYDYFETYGTVSPVSLIQGGGSSYDYLLGKGNPLMLITELPYFQSPQISDKSETSKTRRDVILESVAESRTAYKSVQAILETIAPEMTLDTRFYRAVTAFTEQALTGLDSKENWAKTAEGMDATATKAQATDELYVGPFYRLLVVSMLRRAIDVQLEQKLNSRLEAARHTLESLLETWTSTLETHLEYEAIPIKKLVEVQYGALLAVLDSSYFQN